MQTENIVHNGVTSGIVVALTGLIAVAIKQTYGHTNSLYDKLASKDDSNISLSEKLAKAQYALGRLEQVERSFLKSSETWKNRETELLGNLADRARIQYETQDSLNRAEERIVFLEVEIEELKRKLEELKNEQENKTNNPS